MKIDRKRMAQKLAGATSLLEAISRTKSFTRAADELGIHQSAISHKVRSLEEELGFALFTRTTRNVVPTLQGAPICEASATSNEAINKALDELQRLQRAEGTILSLSSSLAMKWVVPAMSRAQALGLKITLDINDDLSAFGQREVPQAAIRFGNGPYPGLHATILSRCHVIPVASRDTAPLRSAGTSPTFLLRDTRAEEDGTQIAWENYLGTEAYESGRFDKSMVFDRTDVAIQAAIGGLGHALGRTLLVENDLETGLLFNTGPPVSVASKYWLVTTPDFAQTKAYESLAAWLAGEVRTSKRILNSHLKKKPPPEFNHQR